MSDDIKKQQLAFFAKIKKSIPTGKYRAPKWNMKNALKAYWLYAMNEWFQYEKNDNDGDCKVLTRSMRLDKIHDGIKAFLKYGYTYKDIASITNVPYSTVMYHAKKIQKKEEILKNSNHTYELKNNDLKIAKKVKK